MDEKYIWAYGLKNSVEHNGVAIAGSVLPGLFNCGLEKSDVKNIMPEINVIVKKINKLSWEEQKVLFKKYEDLIGHRPEREGLPEIPHT
jgi:hypothetical protein